MRAAGRIIMPCDARHPRAMFFVQRFAGGHHYFWK
jgi:hypothetical protein